MSILNTFDRYLVGFRRMREAARTERLINALPAEVRKDIGWPDGGEDLRWRTSHRLRG